MEGNETPSLAAAGLTLVDVQALADHVVNLLQTQGETALRVVTNILKLIRAVAGRDMLAVFAILNDVTVDVQKLIQAVKDEFGLS